MLKIKKYTEMQELDSITGWKMAWRINPALNTVKDLISE